MSELETERMEQQAEFRAALNPEYRGVRHAIIYAKYVFLKTPKAKKRHQCSICHRPIQIGERYCLVKAGDGPAPSVSHWREFKLCSDCEVRTFNLLRFKRRTT